MLAYALMLYWLPAWSASAATRLVSSLPSLNSTISFVSLYIYSAWAGGACRLLSCGRRPPRCCRSRLLPLLFVCECCVCGAHGAPTLRLLSEYRRPPRCCSILLLLLPPDVLLLSIVLVCSSLINSLNWCHSLRGQASGGCFLHPVTFAIPNSRSEIANLRTGWTMFLSIGSYAFDFCTVTKCSMVAL